jgi:NAD(P)-dependent dehydrogenase (short-subunit alcohol dehydrogenase family)
MDDKIDQLKLSILITGGSGFLGKAIAKHFFKKGFRKLLITSRTDNGEIEKRKDPNVCYLPGLDLTKEKNINILYKQSNSFFLSKFHIINCAGSFPKFNSITSTSIKIAKETWESNYLTVHATAQKLLPLMIKFGGGHFITFSSHTNYQNFPMVVPFTAAKVALEALTKGIANENMKDGIFANSISLPTILTEEEQKLKPYGDHANWIKTDEIAEFVYDFLQSAKGFINGNIVHFYKYSESFFGQSYYDRIKPGASK